MLQVKSSIRVLGSTGPSPTSEPSTESAFGAAIDMDLANSENKACDGTSCVCRGSCHCNDGETCDIQCDEQGGCGNEVDGPATFSGAFNNVACLNHTCHKLNGITAKTITCMWQSCQYAEHLTADHMICRQGSCVLAKHLQIGQLECGGGPTVELATGII